MSGTLRERTERLRVPIALAASVAIGPALTWFGFVIARGFPGECGGDASPCPPGSGSALLAFAAAAFVLIPLVIALTARRRPELSALALALGFGGIAIGVFASRFIADPITDSATGTVVFVAVAGCIAGLALLIAVALAVLRDSAETERCPVPSSGTIGGPPDLTVAGGAGSDRVA